jgi:DNA-binding Lrp family transcriptional regulator
LPKAEDEDQNRITPLAIRANDSGGINIVVGITMLKVSPGHEAEAYRHLKNMENVKEVYRIAGEFHFFVIIQTEDKAILYRLVDAIKEMPVVTAIWNVLISKDNIRNKEAMYLNRLKAHPKISIC